MGYLDNYSALFFFGFDAGESVDFVEGVFESDLIAEDSLDVELLLEPLSGEVLSAAADFL